ncbi:ATP-binding protein [Maribacter chungangensis]|uniref:ATP-binding protein n=1 Tax=Maribacter chungangensis TaxID=1069117 RepID=A0ABW3B9J2_9FLAO
METLFDLQEQLLEQVDTRYRYLLKKIDWNERLIAIKGARGTGKTTMLLQYIKFELGTAYTPLYVSLDNLYFSDNNLVSLAQEFVLHGGTHLFLDEVHKYPNWSRELKLIYDQFPRLRTVFTSSSMLEIYKGESDLSRRAVNYHLKELSFREFVLFEKGIELPNFEFDQLLKDHNKIAKIVKKDLGNPLKDFRNFLNYGSYPYFLQGQNGYLQKLLRTINLIIEVDVNAVENIPYSDSLKIKRLLVAIAQSVPFTPNISKLSERLGISREFLINSIKLLNRADLVMELFKPDKGIGQFTKPQKLYLNNTNLIRALSKNVNEIGTMRETFYANMFKNLNNHEIHLAGKGDFLIDRKYIFEIGEKGKSTRQIKGLDNAYVVRDDIELGSLNVIPLYLFGLLY